MCTTTCDLLSGSASHSFFIDREIVFHKAVTTEEFLPYPEFVRALIGHRRVT